YVYRALDLPVADWAPANDALRAHGAQLFAQTALAGAAAAAHFDGIYTYDIVTYGGETFARLCGEAHAAGLLCAPSVGPGYDAQRRVVEVDVRVGPRLEPERGRPLVGAAAEQHVGRDHPALPGLAARDAFELAQLLERVDAHVRVRADADGDPAVNDARDGRE